MINLLSVKIGDNFNFRQIRFQKNQLSHWFHQHRRILWITTWSTDNFRGRRVKIFLRYQLPFFPSLKSTNYLIDNIKINPKRNFFSLEKKKNIYIYIYMCVCVCVCVCFSSGHIPPSPLITTRHQSLSSIISGRSSKLLSVSALSWYKKVIAGRPKLKRPLENVSVNSVLFFLLFTAFPDGLTWMFLRWKVSGRIKAVLCVVAHRICSRLHAALFCSFYLAIPLCFRVMHSNWSMDS